MTAPFSPQLQEIQPYQLKSGIEVLVRKEKPKFNDIQVRDRTNWIYSLAMNATRKEAISALLEYRTQQLTPIQYLKEKHKPNILGKHLNAADKAKPDTVYEPHAIISGAHGHARAARAILARYRIRIDDADNGVWLPNFKRNVPHEAFPDAPAHRTVHTPQYFVNATALLNRTATEDEARIVLRKIGTRLQQGRFPFAKNQEINVKEW